MVDGSGVLSDIVDIHRVGYQGLRLVVHIVGVGVATGSGRSLYTCILQTRVGKSTAEDDIFFFRLSFDSHRGGGGDLFVLCKIHPRAILDPSQQDSRIYFGK